jgi:hypothetical protein
MGAFNTISNVPAPKAGNPIQLVIDATRHKARGAAAKL